jgi:hypothetical protein
MFFLNLMFSYSQPLAITAYSLSTIAMASLGTVLLLQKMGTSVPPWITMLSIATVVSSYSGGVTPVFYVVVSEIFSFQVRS